MEVQVVLEETWSKGEQTIDISKYFPGCPYIMNFCNLTQVNKGVIYVFLYYMISFTMVHVVCKYIVFA